MSPSIDTPALDLLGHLLRAQGRPVHASFFAYEYGATPKAIQKHEQQLERYGCRIEHDLHGTRLIEAGLGTWADYLEYALAETDPRTIEVYQRTASTQDLAKARTGKRVLILADEQTGGRGRLGRSWHAPRGTGLLFSLTHTPGPYDAASIDRVSFLAAVAVAQAIENITEPKTIQIRWPNDLLVDGRKLAGILVETVSAGPAAPPTLVIGIGINVGLNQDQLDAMPAELRDTVTSFALYGWKADRLLVAECVVKQLEHNLRDAHIPLLVDEWRVRNLYRDQTLTFLSNGHTLTGTVLDLDPDHGLIVRRNTGEIVHLHAATTSVVK